ncbi:MAG: response regulator [Negativicutes bacterium]|nr:response regulator [Negativicutes bacterium]
MKILVVDDEKFNLVMARDIIEAGVENDGVLLCSNPEEVMPLLARQDIGIVLLDIIMPKIDGIALLREIRKMEEYKDLQIIMFTGLTDKNSLRICFDHGANDFITKPIDVTEFTARMKAAVKARNYVSLLKEMFDKSTEQYNQLQEVTKKLKDTQFYLLQQEKLASLGELAAGIAHEINNPIGFIGSNLETLASYAGKLADTVLAWQKFAALATDGQSGPAVLLREKQRIQDKEQQQKMGFLLEDIGPLISESQDGVERVAKIVRSLLNFAKTGQEDEMAVNELNQIVEEALLICRNEVKYTANVDRRLGTVPQVFCDRRQIAQVLINIVLNASGAIKSQGRDGMGNITIETYQEGRYVVCRISDDGPGISADHLGRIFDPFFTTKEVGSGTGLGLSIAYGIVQQHGGELSAESESGKGASFSVKLPWTESV